MKYGYFDDGNREYVITNPKTPVKWINYIGTLAFGGFVDHTGGALICKDDPALDRITKYLALNSRAPRSTCDSGKETAIRFFLLTLSLPSTATNRMNATSGCNIRELYLCFMA
jgi:hypothetical protein